jgi:predicted GTPase
MLPEKKMVTGVPSGYPGAADRVKPFVKPELLEAIAKSPSSEKLVEEFMNA